MWKTYSYESGSFVWMRKAKKIHMKIKHNGTWKRAWESRVSRAGLGRLHCGQFRSSESYSGQLLRKCGERERE